MAGGSPLIFRSSSNKAKSQASTGRRRTRSLPEAISDEPGSDDDLYAVLRIGENYYRIRAATYSSASRIRLVESTMRSSRGRRCCASPTSSAF